MANTDSSKVAADATQVNGEIFLKLAFDNDGIRLRQVHQKISFSELLKLVVASSDSLSKKKKEARNKGESIKEQVTITMADEEGEEILCTDDEDLKAAIQYHRAMWGSSPVKFKVHLLEDVDSAHDDEGKSKEKEKSKEVEEETSKEVEEETSKEAEKETRKEANSPKQPTNSKTSGDAKKNNEKESKKKRKRPKSGVSRTWKKVRKAFQGMISS